jgi:gliding motility-associated-like protein
MRKNRLTILCLFLLLFTGLPMRAQIITTIAGNHTIGFSGVGGPATSAAMAEPYGVAVDAAGNVYAPDNDDNVVWKISSTGIITILAGTGVVGYSGDGGPGTAATLNTPTWIGCDPAGNVYFTDQKGVYIRKVNTAGIISTVAGNPAAHFSGGDGGPLSAATFYGITGIVPDNAGNIYITDNNTIRKVNSAGIINTIAGNGTAGFSGDGGPALAASLQDPAAVGFDAAGNVYIPDAYNQRIRKVNTAGIITTIAGTGAIGNTGDGGPAVNATLGGPWQVVVDAAGNIYVDDEGNYRIRKIDNTGTITDYAGNGNWGYAGDGGPATGAEFNFINGIAIDNSGNIYVSDCYNHVIRKISNCVLATISQQPVAAAVCVGTNATFSVTASGSTGYQWQVNTGSGWTNLSDGGVYSGSAASSLSISAVTGGMNGNQYQCQVTSACATTPTTAAVLTVNTASPPTITIAATAATVCAGTPVTYTASPTNGGSAPSYQWLLNGVNTGANSTTYTNPTPANGDIVSCVLTSNVTCVLNPTAASNTLALTVSPILTPALSIAASAAAICAGSPVSFTASPTNGGVTPSYQWQVNGINAGTNNTVFTSSSLANGDVVSCILSSVAACVSSSTAVSNPVPMTVNPVVTPGVTISASYTAFCTGVPVTFTASATNGGTTPGYQWLVNGAPAGTDNTTFTSSSLANGGVVSCVMTSNAVCTVASTASSNGVMVAVNPPVTPSVGISASATIICAGAPVSFMAVPTNGGATPSYQWQVNGINVGTNNTVFTSSALANGDVVDCILSGDAGCATNPTAVSNSIPVTVNPDVTAGVSIAASAETICAGTAVSFTASPSNGGTTPGYQWQVNGAPQGTDNPTFQSKSLANGDVISCVLTSSLSCSSPVNSGNTVVMTVNPVPTVTLIPDTIIAYGQSVIIGAIVGIGSGGSISSYTWVPATGLNNPTVAEPVAAPGNSTTYQLTVESSEGCTASGEVKIGVFRKFDMPNAFTPNGDGKNDVFRVPPSEAVELISFVVYNRWGARVFMTTNSGTGWDGTVGGQAQPAGAYIWQVEYKDILIGKSVRASGTVMLVR